MEGLLGRVICATNLSFQYDYTELGARKYSLVMAGGDGKEGTRDDTEEG